MACVLESLRKHICRFSIWFVLFTAVTWAAQASNPNIVLLFSDDQGTLDLNCYGSKDLQTPHLDGLAQRGLKFTQFYTASPVCSPSRAALLTGRHPIRAGLNTNAPNYPGHSGMPSDEITLAELLKKKGYATALFGKWHLGTTPECEPLGQGFDEFFGHKSGCIDNYSHFFYWQEPHVHDLYHNHREVWHNGEHFTDLVVGHARRFIKENREKPFFLYIPFNVPHYPLQAPDKFRKMYEHLSEPRRSYAASVSALDNAAGKILEELRHQNLERKTLVIFLSDHGHSTEPRTNFGGGNPGSYRGSKFSVLEGGIRVPCIVSWPGELPAGETRDQLAVSYDWFPTLAEIVEIPLPERKYDGRSLVGVLRKNEATPHDVVHWQLGDQWAVRHGDWKLAVNANDTKMGTKVGEKVFLSNLAADVTEQKNLAEENPDRVKQLTQWHEQWVQDVRKKL